MKIRPMTIDDCPAAYALGSEFSSIVRMKIPVDRASFDQTMINWLGKEATIAFVAESDDGNLAGMICALGYVYPWNYAALVGEELFWWVDAKYRNGSAGMRLFDALLSEAKLRGWNALSMSASTRSCSFGSVSRLYERRGFEVCDHKYWKDINKCLEH